MGKSPFHELRRARRRGKTLRSIAHKLDLLYFGSVDQHSDDHAIIRGITASTHHRDSHFSVGSYNGYDLSIVDRLHPKKRASSQPASRWIILQLTLRSPHASSFFMPTGRDEAFRQLFSGVHQLVPLEHSLPTTFTPEFSSRYTIYSTPSAATDTYNLVTPDLQVGMSARFWPHAVEIQQDKVYVYITEHHLDEAVLLSSIASALWLAETLDGQGN